VLTLGDELRYQRVQRRGGEGSGCPDDPGDREELPESQCAECGQQGQYSHRRGADDVRHSQYPLAIHPVGDRAADQQQRYLRQGIGQPDIGKRRRLIRDGIGLPGNGDDEHPVADQ
jgi:hypothetical protein